MCAPTTHHMAGVLLYRIGVMITGAVLVPGGTMHHEKIGRYVVKHLGGALWPVTHDGSKIAGGAVGATAALAWPVIVLGDLVINGALLVGRSSFETGRPPPPAK